MLTLFLGGLGIHKFYAGKWVQGLIYLVLMPTYIPLALSLLDLLSAIFSRAEDGEIYV